MAGALGIILFAYTCLVFLVNHRIYMMQCNPMSKPGVYQSDMGDLRSSGHLQADGSHHNRREQPNIRRIRFEPSYLDFHEKSVGMPSIRTVSIINPHTDQNLQLQSISGSTVHFHASFFQSKVVHPLGNTTFEIVFLARLVGNVENTLFIHTSKGVYPYQVFGVGVPNPYRLRPFLGARVPLNFSFSALINMHNPYNLPLQVIEMYSSGGDLHLELPSGLEEAPQKHWEIPPYETKALMRASFVGRVASNHTAFIRIKASQPAPNQELLILPFEVEVTTAPGLFSSADLLDFGTLRTMDEPKSIGLYLVNAGHKQVHISAVSIEPPNSALSIGFTPTLLKPGSKYIKIATATYSAFQVKRSRQASGKVVIKTNSKITPRLEIPYHVNILQGTIAYSVSKTRFFVGRSPFVPITKELPITNSFLFTMIIYDAVFPPEVDHIFSIVNFTKPARIPPQRTVTPFYVQFLANGSDIAFSTILRVYTNASIFTVPIHCFDGKLKYAVDGLEEDVVDYGTVGTAENRTKLLKIFNNNPIEVTIYRIECNIKFGRIKLLGSEAINESKHAKGNNTPSTTTEQHPANAQQANDGKVSIKAGFVTYFSVEVAVPKQEGQYIGEIEVDTDYETLHIPLHLKAMDGKVVACPTTVIFNPGFPGQILNQSLTLVSSFSNTLKLLSVENYPSDDQFSFERVSSEVKLLPNQKIQVGQLFYNPQKGCKHHCYTGIEEEEKWLSSFSLPPEVGELDAFFIEKNQKMFSSLERAGNHKFNVSFTVDTDVVKGFKIPAVASLSWPSFSFDKPVKFPLTHIGNSSSKIFVIENPADVSVVIQVVPLALYSQNVWDLLADRFDTETYGFDPDENTFSISTNEGDTLISPPSFLRSSVSPAPGTMVTVLKSRSTVAIPMQFQPKDERLKTSLFLIRNNLTVLDGIVVQGQGARGEFTLNGQRPGSHSKLLFEIKPIQLADCHKAAPPSRSLPSLSVMKTVTATNPGQLAVFISSLLINGYECEGYGFKIINCKSFILKPNTSRKIEITFTPDFSMSRVTRRLEVRTTLGRVMEFTLVATIPTHLLPLCSSALGRNSWEPVIQIVAAVLMTVVFLAVVIAAHAEARRLVFLSHPEVLVLQMKAEEQRGPIFDLNAIAGVKKHKVPVSDEPSVGPKRPKRETHDIREATPVTSDNRTSASESALTSLADNSPTNNNNKTGLASGTRQETSGMRNRTTKSEISIRTPPSPEYSESRGVRSSCPSLDSKTLPSARDSRSKSAATAVRTVTDEPVNTNQKLTELRKVEHRAVEETRKTEGKNRSCPENLNDEIISVVIPNKHESASRKDIKEAKGKQKRKVKAMSKKEEKDKKTKIKDSMAVKSRDDEGALSDDSCSDGSSDKSVPEGRTQQLAKEVNRTRQGSLPNIQLVSCKEQQASAKPNSQLPTADVADIGRERGRRGKIATETVVSKSKKAEAQFVSGSGRPKSLELPLKFQSNASKSQNNANNPGGIGKANEIGDAAGATSPHAIAAAVMTLALGKNMQASSKENNFDDTELTKCKAYTKSPALSTTLPSDSPPPTSSTLLSGSSRSSSYSSIVSSDSTSGGEQVKAAGTKGTKARVKGTNSVPLASGSVPSWSASGASRSSKLGEELGVGNLGRNPWSVPPETCRSPVRERVATSPYLQSSRPSLAESQPFHRNTLKKQSASFEEKVRPFDLSDLGLSDSRGFSNGPPNLWNSTDMCCNNPDSLFSASSRPANEQLHGKNTWQSNNWVNFLDASNMNDSAVTSNKTMAEIWDVGKSPVNSDGWSVYPSTAAPTQPINSEANAVDALFSHMPDNWSGSSSRRESPFNSQEIRWTAPSDVASIWGSGYLVPGSNADPVPSSSGASFASYPVQPQQSQDSQVQPSFEHLGSLGSSIWNPSGVNSTWPPTSE